MAARAGVGIRKLATRDFPRVARGVFSAYWADDLLGLGAEMSYNYLFALFPFFMFLSALLGFIGERVGQADLFTLVMRFIAMLVPTAIQDLVREWAYEVVYTRSPGLLTISAAFALFGATAGIGVLNKGLDRAHQITVGRPFWRGFLYALAATLALDSVIFAGFVTYTLGGRLVEYIPATYAANDAFLGIWEFLHGPGLVIGLFVVITILYVVLPNTRVRVVHAAAGALFATLAWVVITRGFGLYLQYLGNFAFTYGAFATAIVLMVWMYGVSTVLLVGGEISAVLAGRSFGPASAQVDVAGPESRS
jgi:membrane protein